MKAKKILAMTLATAMTVGMLAGCGSTGEKKESGSDSEQITLNYWTWFPSKDQIQETVDAFEKENPNIKINMTVMESKAFQEKVPLALSTEEDIDVIGVQPSAFAEEVQDYLANLDELMPDVVGTDWKDAYSEKCLEQGNQLTSGDTKMLVLTNSGSMVGFYNAALLKDIGAEVPKTFAEYKAVAEAFKAKYPDKYVSVFAGKDSWVVDEMMLTVLGQQGDYYNKWRYEGAPVDSDFQLHDCYEKQVKQLIVPFSTGIEDINMTSKKTKLKVTKRNNKAGFLFLLPLIVIFIGLLGYSFYFLILNSFRDVTITFRRSEFVGLANYQTIFKDKSFWISLLNTFILSTANIFCGLTFGFIISIILNFKIKGKRFFHALFFIPSMLPIALMATVFGSMLEYKNGIVNQILRGVGLGALAQRWLADPKLAMGAVCSVSIFMIGIPIMYYTADLTTISRSILEAATIDGAGMKDQLLLIIFPVLKNTHKTIILSMLLGGFREMERVYLMTDGGPGGSTEIIGTYIYRATRSAGSNIGLVCAAAIIVLIVAFIISFIQLKMTSKNG